ncbi:Uma2 family endonuclease [Nocardia sp. GAS34]|uniref:Uma2 family endonuclease n=1 Tax=unclassified Nocardia TaxID=2637762 RepID=UPI003D1F04A1
MEHPSDGSRLELIWGYLHVTPPPTSLYQHVLIELIVLLRDALRGAGRTDLRVLPGIGIRISTRFRTGVIPDIAVIDTDIDQTSFGANSLQLAVELWSPGNTRQERDDKIAAYASAGVRYLWLVEFPKGKPMRFWGYRLGESSYEQVAYADAGEVVTAPGPVPVKVPTAQPR